MKLISIARRSVEDTPSRAPEICVLFGQILVLLTTLLVAVMPVTEYLWTFDKFLRGGQDCEFGLLALAAVFCLMLVLSHQRRAVLALILSLRRVLSSLFQPADPAARLCPCMVSSVQYNLPRNISLHSINLPLQI
ncbi:hypothetical protein RBB75_14875 [Tunturibacter empetritectus]|uniref:Uncharacterized protein n=1 Tax=Tunturiibacter empetritectus TaxID=3069691 RepID=A0AAU7ZB61_9BACT